MSQLSLFESKLSFNNVNFSVIDKDNQIWLRGSQISKALDYRTTDAITKIYTRNKDEFTENMTQVIEIFEAVNLTASRKTKELRRKIRIFSLRGCHLLAMLASTPVAKSFRKWVLDVLESQVEIPQLPSVKELPPATPKLPPLMIEYEPEPWEEQHAEKLINNFHYKDYAYNSYLLSCKANALFNEFEEKIKDLMQDYDKLSNPVYKEMLGRVMERPYDDLLDTSSLNTKEERNRHNEYAEFTSQMWETLCRTRNNLTYRKDELRNEVQHSIRTLVSIAKLLDM